MPSVQQIFREALVCLLYPVVRLALRHAVKFQDFEAVAKQAFLRAATEELQSSGSAVTASKLSVMTGIQRRDIRRIENSQPPSHGDLITRVIGLWREGARFRGKNGRPRTLSFHSGAGEFVDLVQSVSSDLNPYTVLFELERARLAEQNEDGVSLLRPGYQPADLAEGLRLLGKDSSDLHRVVEYNLFAGQQDRQLHIKTEYDNIPSDKLPLVREWFMEQGTQLHARARAFLSAHDIDVNPQAKGLPPPETRLRAAIGTFAIVEVAPKGQKK